jgi:ribosome maturation factor RimP
MTEVNDHEDDRRPTGDDAGIGPQIGMPGDPRESRIVLQVWALAEPVCREEGLELIFVEYQRESAGRVLRLYVDRPQGVTLSECVAVSRQVSDLLDVHLDDAGPYSMEVSSPGSDRPLGRTADFDRFEGEEAVIKTIAPIDGQKNFKGVLEGLVGQEVRITTPARSIDIPLAQIRKARLLNYNGEGRCS